MDIHNTNISNSDYGPRRKELLKLVKQLREMGAEADLEVPSIVVIGNQSSGKSSLIEAICGIGVPRDAGACTRCPMEFRLVSSPNPWSCQVRIRSKSDTKGRIGEVLFGPRITDKSHVELALRRAQAAVRHDSVPSDVFLSKSKEELKEEFEFRGPMFSYDVVCVDLEGPELIDLSFLDLPGLVYNDNRVANRFVHVSLSEDLDTQKADDLARRVDPEGRRTIGVLTKADTLTVNMVDERNNWLEVVEGRRNLRTQGYYCTIQPASGQMKRGITREEARALEQDFFAKSAPWSIADGRHFGTNNLISVLERLLMQMISKSLPHITSETERLLQECKKQLSGLPEVTKDPITNMMGLIRDFSDKLKGYVDGSPSAPLLVQKNKIIFKEFNDNILSTCPNFQPFVDEKEACLFQAGGGTMFQFSAGKPSFLMEVKEYIAKSITREFPGHVPFEVVSSRVRQMQATWESTVINSLSSVRNSVYDVFVHCIVTTFSQYPVFKETLKCFVLELMDHHYDKCLLLLRNVMRWETRPFTHHQKMLAFHKRHWLETQKKYRADFLSSPSITESAPGTILSQPTCPWPENYEVELDFMAEVGVYCVTMTQSFSDTITKATDISFVQAVSDELHEFLISKLQLGSDGARERCTKYLAEDPLVAAKRDNLTAWMERLEKVRLKLMEID